MGVIHIAGDSTKGEFGGSGFTLKAEGWYDVRFDQIQPYAGDPAKNKGPALILKGVVVDSDSKLHLGEPISQFMSIDPERKGSGGRWRVLLEQMQVPYNVRPGPQGEGVEFDSDHLLGRFVRVRIKHNKGSGDNANKTYENWDEVAMSRYNNVQQAPNPNQGYVQPPQQGQYAPPSHMPGQGNPPPAR